MDKIEGTFSLYGRWDELEEIPSAKALLDKLAECAAGSYMVKDLTLGSDAPGNLLDNQGNPFEDFGEFQRMYPALGISGIFTLHGLDTAANSYPMPEEICLDKQGNVIPFEVTPSMSAFNIMEGVVALMDPLFEGFPHHCYFEELVVDIEAKQLRFSMGS